MGLNIFNRSDEPKPFKPYDPILDSGSPLIVKIVKKTPLFSTLLISIVIMSIVGIVGRFTFLKRFNNIDMMKEPFFAVSLFGLKDVINGDQDVVIPTAVLIRSDKPIAVKNKKGAKDLSLTVPKTSRHEVVKAKDYGIADRSIMVDDSYIFNTDKTGTFAPNGTFKKIVKAKDDSYFDDALFIGDSRTVGLYLFSSLKGKTNFFCRESTNVFNFPTREIDYHGKNGEEGRTTIDELLKNHSFKKIYISLGVNEMARPSLDYYKNFRAIVENIRNKQPKAIIFIQGSINIAPPRCQTDPVFNNTNLYQRNKAIAELANGRDIFYIDPNKAVCDENGDLKAEYTSDQIHFKANYYNLWVDFLRDNVVY